MALKTAKQYYKSLESLHPTAYILGEKVENVHEHPLIKHMTAAVAKTFELENDPEGRQFLVTKSDLTGEVFAERAVELLCQLMGRGTYSKTPAFR